MARNEGNDSLFVSSDVPELLIEGIGRASPIEEPEACVYGYGAVRFLTNAVVSTRRPSTPTDQSIGRRLARHGAVPLMVLHLQMINEAVNECTLVKLAAPNTFRLSAGSVCEAVGLAAARVVPVVGCAARFLQNTVNRTPGAAQRRRKLDEKRLQRQRARIDDTSHLRNERVA